MSAKRITVFSLVSAGAAVFMLMVLVLYSSVPSALYRAAGAALAIFAISALLLASRVLSRRVFGPSDELANGLARLCNGDFKGRLGSEGGGEDSTLAAGLSSLPATEQYNRLATLLDEKFKHCSALVGYMPDPIIELDCEGVVRYMNEAATNITGCTLEEITGRPVALLFDTGARNTLEDFLEGTMNGETVRKAELPMVSKDGRANLFEFNSVPMYKDGVVAGCHCIGRDIEERKKLTLELTRAREDGESSALQLKKTIRDLEEFALLAVRRELKMQEIRERFERLRGEHKLERDLPE